MERLFKKIKKETLNLDEKTKIYSTLRNFVAENPVRNIKSPFYESWFVFRQRMIAIPIAVILIFVLTAGSTVFAAKKSLPGDKLYPVKMLNEKVESIMALGPKAKAQVEVSHAISRLEEVEQLVTSNKQLGKGSGEEMGNNFQAQAQDATDNINELKNNGREEDASKIHSDFKTMLTVHEKTITELSNSTSTETETKKELDRVVFDVHSELEKKLEENRYESEKSDNDSNNSGQTDGEVKGVETRRESKTEKNGSRSSESEIETETEDH